MGFFLFFELGKFHFEKYKNLFSISVSRNIRKAFFWENIRKFRFLKYKKIFYWENIRNFFRADFFRKKYKKVLGEKFWRLRLESALGSSIWYYYILAGIHFIFLKKVLDQTWKSFNIKFGFQEKDQESTYQVRQILKLFWKLVDLILA